jgi:hypothetical protein
MADDGFAYSALREIIFRHSASAQGAFATRVNGADLRMAR